MRERGERGRRGVRQPEEEGRGGGERGETCYHRATTARMWKLLLNLKRVEMRPTRFSCLLLFSRFSEKKLDKNLLCIQFHFFTMRDGFIWDLLMTEKGSIRILRNYGFPSSRKNF